MRRTPASTWAVVTSLAAGFGLRMLVLPTSLYELDSDRAIVYLMPQRFLAGDFEVFFWGQAYGGTLLQLSMTVPFAVLGASPTVFTATGLLWWALAAIALRQTVRWVAGRRAGDVAAVLFWWPGVLMLDLSMEDPAFYGTTLALGLGCTWLAARDDVASWRWWALFGLLAGLAVWTSPVGLGYAVAAGLVMLTRGVTWRWLLAVVAGGLLGSAPWLFINVTMGFPSLETGAPEVGTPLERLRGFFAVLVPATFRLFWPVGGRGDLVVLWSVVAVLVAYAAWSVVAAMRARDARRVLLPLAGGLALAVVVQAGFPVVESAARYVAFLLPVIAAAAAALVAWSRVLAVVVAAGAVVATTVSVWQATSGLTDDGLSAFGAGVPEVVEYLDATDSSRVYASYWLSFRITAQSGEEVIAAPLTNVRYEPYRQSVEQASQRDDRTVLVVYPDQPNDTLLSTDPALPPHTRTVVGGYAVYEFDGWFDPYALDVSLF